jgi:hypothetical protein
METLSLFEHDILKRPILRLRDRRLFGTHLSDEPIPDTVHFGIGKEDTAANTDAFDVATIVPPLDRPVRNAEFGGHLFFGQQFHGVIHHAKVVDAGIHDFSIFLDARIRRQRK